MLLPTNEQQFSEENNEGRKGKLEWIQLGNVFLFNQEGTSPTVQRVDHDEKPGADQEALDEQSSGEADTDDVV